MATIRLVPSAYSLSNTTRLSISNPTNMYTDTDSTTYAVVTNSRTKNTTSYYAYVSGFNFNAVPDNAIVNSFTVKIKFSQTDGSTASNYRPMLVQGTTTITGQGGNNPTSGEVQTLTFTGVTADWDTIKGYGSNFGIRINCRCNSTSTTTTPIFNIYGAEILVEYALPVERTVTTSVVGSGSIEPLGSTTVYDGDSFSLKINSSTKNFTVTDNGVDVTSQVEEKTASGTVTSVPQNYSTSGSITGTYYQQAVGKDHNASNNTNNNYCSTSGSTATISYGFDVSSVPSGATIKSVTCKVKGHAESTSASNRKAQVQLYSGSTAKGTAVDFSSTTDSVYEIDGGSWTREELNNAQLNFTIGYYGGNIAGATFEVEYEVSGGEVFHQYDIATISSDHTIVVTFGEITQMLYAKSLTGWKAYSRAFKKVNGAWVEQSNLSTVFDSTKKYARG